jgi:hypothetical protein
MTTNGQAKIYNPFQRMDETPVQPPFLVRDTHPDAVIRRHQQRMANHPAGPVEIALPQRSEAAMRGKAALGLDFDQQEALIDALTGAYAEKHWQDMWAKLYKRWGLGDILDTILGAGQVHPDRVRRVISPLLFSLSPEIDEEARALLFLFRAWQLRQQVVVERRAMSLLPVVGGEVMGSITSFTPALKRMDTRLWRLGWPGDERAGAPRIISGDIAAALQQALPLFNEWYFDDQKRGRAETMKRQVDHIHLVPWGDRLRQDHILPVGQAKLEEVSHNNLFRLEMPDGRKLILRGEPVAAVRAGLAAANGSGQPPAPTLAKINTAYLAALTKRGESSESCEKAEAADVKPFDTLNPLAAYVVSIEGRNTRREIIVTWVKGHKQALAVISGSNHPARAVVMFNNVDRLGVAPVNYQTKRPEIDQLWASSPTAGLIWDTSEGRLAISHWAAWVWHEKAGSYPPPQWGKK